MLLCFLLEIHSQYKEKRCVDKDIVYVVVGGFGLLLFCSLILTFIVFYKLHVRIGRGSHDKHHS